jgi:NAD-dependent dihydropyrimidine dehydrogenase PreA subunit
VTYVIADPCVDLLDKSCVDVCPVDCIYYDEGEDRMLYIEPNECIDCGACEPVCPVEAIFEESALPEKWKEFYDINTKWFEDKDAVRARIDEMIPPGSRPPAEV